MAFCQSPEAYFEAYEDFYESLDKLEKRLETNRFIFGDYITDADVIIMDIPMREPNLIIFHIHTRQALMNIFKERMISR